ncbi:MAG: peptidylprolyl isomerase [Parvibaculaceae bacterium]|nr:peptidylprolyl isomerase [Parvibaculaceae bacterium]
MRRLNRLLTITLLGSAMGMGFTGGLSGIALAATATDAKDAKTPSSGDIIATVDGTPIRVSDIEMAEEEVGPALSRLPEEIRFQYLLSMLIDRRIIQIAAHKQKMEDDPRVKRREAYYDEKAVRDVYWIELMKSRITDADAKAYYDKQISEAKPQEEVHAEHILVGTKEEAEKAIAEITAGKSFEDVAKEVSKDGSAAKGGDLGWFTKDQMVPAFADAAFSLKPGTLSGPVQSEFGWHVIKVLETRDKPKPTFEQMKPQIIQTLAQQEGQKLMEEMRQKSKVEFIGPDGKPVAAQLGKASDVAGQQQPADQPQLAPAPVAPQ